MSKQQAEQPSGPWKLDDDRMYVIDGRGRFVCQLGDHGEIKPWKAYANRDVNAGLLIAAPDLLSACEAALSHVSELRDAWQRGALNECDGGGGTRSNRNVDVECCLRAAIKKARGTTP